MKKMRILGCLILFLVQMFLGCATIPIKPLSQSDLPDLKGRWEGVRHGTTYTLPTELEISNENLEGKIIFHGATAGTVSYQFYGKIENGKLVSSWGRDRWIKLSFRKGEGKMKLEGDYQWMQWSGTMSLHKVVK